MIEFRYATPTGVVQASEFTIPLAEAENLHSGRLTVLADGLLFQPDRRQELLEPTRGAFPGVMMAVEAAGAIEDPEGGLSRVAPSIMLFQERASVQVTYPGFFRRCLQRARGRLPEAVTATLERQQLASEPVHSSFEVGHEPRISISTPPLTQVAAVPRNLNRALLDHGPYGPADITVACGVLFDRSVEFGQVGPSREGLVTTYTGKEYWPTGESNSRLPTGDAYDVRLAVEQPNFWRKVHSLARGRRPESTATLTRGARW